MNIKKHKKPIRLGLIIAIVLASAITRCLPELSVYQLDKINENYTEAKLSIFDIIVPEAKAQQPSPDPIPPSPSPIPLLAWLGDTSQHADYTQTELFRDGYVDVQWFDGYNGYRVDSTGVVDSTAGIQACINAVYNEQIRGLIRRVVLFTHQANGTRGQYLISSYLNCRQDQAGRSGYTTMPRHALVGALNANNERPLIKLGTNSANYQDTANPRPMVWYWSEPYPEYDGTTDPTKNDWDVNFRQIFRGIDLDLGASNEGAVGIEFLAAEGSALEDVIITVRDSIAGIGDLATYGNFTVNVEVIGGDYAVKNFPDILFDPRPDQADPIFGQTMAGCKFTNQRNAVFGINNDQRVFLGLVGCHITNTGSVPLSSGAPRTDSGGFMLERCLIEMGSDTTLIPNAPNSNVVIRDTYTKGIDNIIPGGSATITDTANYAHIKEYTHPGNGFDSFIDGSVTRNTTKDIVEGLSYTSQNLLNSLVNISKWNQATFPHYWRSNGGPRDADVLNARTECVSEAGLAVNVPVSFPGQPRVDATAALQAAIDWAAANNKILFLGRGFYYLTDTIKIRHNSRIIGIDAESTVLLASPAWDPTGETPIVQTDNNANSSAVLAYLSIRHYGVCLQGTQDIFRDTVSHINFTNLDWQLGRGSQVRDVHLGAYVELWCNPGTAGVDRYVFRYNRAKVSNNGGGRWWNVHPFDTAMWGQLTSIPFYIKNTNEPMYLYGWNGISRGGGGYGDIKVENSSNKYIYNNVHEAPCIGLYVAGSSNVVQMGTRQNTTHITDSQIVVNEHNGANSNDVFVSTIQIWVRDIKDYDIVRETQNGSNYVMSVTDRDLCVFKRGQPAYTAIDTHPGAPKNLRVLN